MAYRIIYNTTDRAVLQRDMYGVQYARRPGYIERACDIEGVTPDTLMGEASKLLPALGSPYPVGLGSYDAKLIRHNLSGVLTHDGNLEFELEYERPQVVTYVANRLVVVDEYGSYEMLREPVAPDGTPLFLGGLFDRDNPDYGGPRPRIVYAERAVPIGVTVLGGLYTEPNLPLYLREYRGTVNNATWNGKEKGRWLCDSVQMSRVELYNNQIQVRVVLKLRLDRDWSQYVAFEDPYGNVAPPEPRVVTDLEYKYGVQPEAYENPPAGQTWNDRSTSGIIRIGPYREADFAAAFGDISVGRPVPQTEEERQISRRFLYF